MIFHCFNERFVTFLLEGVAARDAKGAASRMSKGEDGEKR